MKKTIEFDEMCKSCSGTGLYIGIAERDGAAVVCRKCKGTGCFHFKHEYEPFTERRESESTIRQVYETNPGICIGTGENGEYRLGDFGGMPYQDWLDGKGFAIGMENRRSTCPAWWYQSANYNLKPSWEECNFGMFSGCKHFSNKHQCWQRWDLENRNLLDKP